ncbi:ribonuclease BN (tRNA processing enzyme) [Micrococcus cohnii]|uniref:Ribonuclease BN (tRNA processing enzyme) n=1 Tax=Micrococcus cohnii TaxID=993416 RepID=A0A7W7M2K1_9MICC|nr:MBL fold metallo-hydrolase [Micrococcus cohnii]MBB4734972.1 ribonuclease BN (tRNA processing enzyme) [Micrococcus cohnii]
MKLTIIGSSGSFPGPGSPASCYLLTAESVAADGVTPKTWRILLDMGNGSLGTLQRYILLEDLDAIALSHLHPDHFMDLCGMHVAIRWNPAGWHAGRVPVLGPSGTAERIAVAYGMDPEPGMREDFEFQTWSPHEPMTVGPFRITPVPVRHPIDEAYALRIEVEETDEDGHERTRVLTYSGDTDSCDGLVEAARDADLFLCEAAFHEGRDDHIEGVHLTGFRAGQMAAQAGAKKLLLTHLPVWNDAQTAVAEARRAYEGPLTVAVSGMSYRV